MSTPRRRWFDAAAGPVVRPYAVTRGRTRSSGEQLDLLATVAGNGPSRSHRRWLDPEQVRLLALCRRPVTVADLSSELGLPLGVVRVLVGDLRDKGLVNVRPPEPRAYARDRRILRTVLDELQAL